jgi:YjbE family integral membrane protein
MDWTTDVMAPWVALAQVVAIDVALAGDNAVVVGMAVAGLPAHQQRNAILLGIGGATVIRVAMGAVALQLLALIGLLLAGGVLLLWVCWKMFREVRRPHRAPAAGDGSKTLREAMMQIVLADVSMSLDNVLAVAGAAHDRFWVLTAGLVLSVALMGLAAGLIARLLERHRWIAWVGLLIVLYVALSMIWHGGHEVAGAMRP